MAIRLLGNFWKGTAPARSAPAGRRAGDWGVESREPSQWNPNAAAAPRTPPPGSELRPLEPIWHETQPCCHD